MQTSWMGIKQIAQREACVLVAYPDDTTGGNKCSLGFGSQTGNPKPGDTITIEDAFIRLKADIAARDIVIAKCLTRPVTQGEWDALASLYFQAGTEAMKAVAVIYNATPAAISTLAALEFAKWGYGANGLPTAGHAKRRIREMAMAALGDYGILLTFLVFDGNPRLVPPRAVPFPPEP
jgi:lysozyme